MRAIFCLNRNGGTVTFHREDGDKKYYGQRHAAGEHNLFYAIKKWLNERGFDLIKKRAQNDGNMIGDQYQPYIRIRSRNSQAPHIAIYSGFYALRGANVDWNEGAVTLILQGGWYLDPACAGRRHANEQQPDWRARIVKIAEEHNDIVVMSA